MSRSSVNLPNSPLIDLYKTLVTARKIDQIEKGYTSRGEAFFHVSGAGHEAVAALNDFLVADDYLHLHYRDKALMLARGMPPLQFFYSLFCKDASHSRGRQMSAHLSDPSLHLLSLVGPVGNNALQAVGVAAEIRQRDSRPIVVCSIGDGTTQQGEVLEAIAEAVRAQLPVLFLIEDNRYAISTLTQGTTFFDLPGGPVEQFYGVPIQRVDGTDISHCHEQFGQIVKVMRASRGPALVHLKVERLADHSNADDQLRYRSRKEIEQVALQADPIARLRQQLIDEGADADALTQLEADIQTQLERDAKSAQRSDDPSAIFSAKRVLAEALEDPSKEYVGNASEPRLSMLDAIGGVLRYQLTNNSAVTLYGEDIEDPKGDVFGVTAGLSSDFPGRVLNSPLSESTIVGTAIGRALAGGRPVAFLQFADFLPLALNQIISELGSMFWRTDGAWQCPVIIMITCGGYRPGLGPFHAQSLEALAAHTPGIDIVMPSTAGDAAGLLNAAFQSQRPTLFFYPKSCLNRKSAIESTSADINAQWVPVGRARVEERGDDITLIAYGNTVDLCRQVAQQLVKAGVTADLIDLRWLSPWDQNTVLESAQKTKNVIVVHEDNLSCGVGAEIIATITELSQVPIHCRRVARADTFVPCNFSNQLEVLPSFKRILETACDMLAIELSWELPPEAEKNIYYIEASGTAPSDESVVVLEWRVNVGDTINAGQCIATFESTKAAFDYESPISGVVEEILALENDEVPIGKPVVKVRLIEGESEESLMKPITKPQDGRPILVRKLATTVSAVSDSAASSGRTGLEQASSEQTFSELVFSEQQKANHYKVGLVTVKHSFGARKIENEALLQDHWEKSANDIVRMTGIGSRHYIDASQTIVSLGTDAAAQALDAAGLTIQDIDLVICATATPDLLSPAVSFRVLYNLGGARFERPAYDINAACAGYVYALQCAYNELKSKPNSRILLITAEVLSTHVDSSDYNTAVIFGDAATATIVAGEAFADTFCYELSEPYLSGSAENGTLLREPHADSEDNLYMDGMAVFNFGVRYMIKALQQVCKEAHLDAAELDLVIPHQANKRIIDVICSRLALDNSRAYSNISRVGNTSSSSIPICLSEILATGKHYNKIGLTAFGSGFASGACLLTRKI